jgi:hypothetical protein
MREQVSVDESGIVHMTCLTIVIIPGNPTQNSKREKLSEVAIMENIMVVYKEIKTRTIIYFLFSRDLFIMPPDILFVFSFERGSH